MIDYIRENLSYYGIYYRLLFKTKKEVTPEYVSFGGDKEQYFLYYEPKETVSDKIIFWVHGMQAILNSLITSDSTLRSPDTDVFP